MLRTFSPIQRQTRTLYKFTPFLNTSRKFSTSKNDEYFKQLFSPNKIQTGSKRVGLYGYSILQEPSDWFEFAKQSYEKCVQLRQQVLDLKVETVEDALKMITLFDDISNTLCLLLDGAELCANVHHDRNFRESARSVSNSFGQYLHTLNTDTELYNQLVTQVIKNQKIIHQLDPLEHRIAVGLAQDMEKNGGVHFHDNKKEEMIELNSKIDLLEQEYLMNLESGHDELVDMPPHILAENPRYRHLMDDNFKINPLYYGYIYTHVKNEELRRIAYIQKYKYTKETFQSLNGLIEARHKLAKMLKYKSYSHLFTHDQLSQSPENVIKFLTDISKKIEKKAQSELELIKKEKMELEGNDNIQEWDYTFYKNFIKKKYELDINLKEYFPLWRCIQGLFMIVEQVFGLKMEQKPIELGEAWDNAIKLEISDHEKVLGHIYLDLFARPDKIPADCHFTIRTGKYIDENTYQNPAGAFVCNFSHKDLGMGLLSHSDLSTLFHEFGHALHNIIGRTKYQNSSGTRTLLDFVETPSQFMENFTLDYRVVSQFAKHYKTNETLSEEKFNQFLKSKKLFSCLELQNNIVLSLFDITLYGEPTGKSPVEIYKELKNKYHSIPFPEGSHGELMVHLSNYASGYYSYLFSKVFSCHIWHKLFKPNPWNPEAGEKFKKELLSHGGALHPKDMIKNLLNEEVDVKYLLKDLGVE